MKRVFNKIVTMMLATGLLTGCADFLNETPNGVLSSDQVNDVDRLLTATYSALGNDHYDAPFSLWPYGTVRSDDAYKGGSGPQDIQVFHFLEVSNNIMTNFGEVDRLWFQCYLSISRANTTIRTIHEAGDFEGKEVKLAEARFLRGHFYFMLKILFKYVPYIDENTPIDSYETVSNRELSNDELWQKIVDDFQYAVDNLPPSQTEIGRANQTAAAAYLAKAYLYKAYRQGDPERNMVTGIDAADLEKVLQNTQIVLSSDYSLEADFAFNFLPGSYENGKEAIFSVQYSKDDGTKFGRVNLSDVLSVPMGLGCCDFKKPSQSLVNAFRTTGNGLPIENYNTLDNYSNTEKYDPRLFHTVAIPGLPYKYNTNRLYEESWNRNPADYSVYASLKENVDPDCDCFVPMVPFYANTKNRILIRFADVLLMRAEALIELHRPQEALPLINEIRTRAKSSMQFTGYTSDKTLIETYRDGVNINWSESVAREALRWERRLELAMENERFFDLVRWGVAEQTMNAYYHAERSRRSYYASAQFAANKHEYLPIPEAQIRLSKYLYQQNPGY
ncbi:RagB/SusD family nutrient uptake outer membrane protein [Sphingobacterium corticibacterium]|uniref:RagB/SusD family nutrient uptake outer membrane protein n=1 Tax=Sphingobacterium corticibacterium TaxID=2484746 RepID=A0A4V2DCM6_9SPHI|nr:RagB/SusD family nutrient uptake outer membrane protein [Sphingobacterium corticibacterium]RZF62018.1 RagB/SusD family nutrient uptake outer membrane protein [Sphingobacterium corticibacterium]